MTEGLTINVQEQEDVDFSGVTSHPTNITVSTEEPSAQEELTPGSVSIGTVPVNQSPAQAGQVPVTHQDREEFDIQVEYLRNNVIANPDWNGDLTKCKESWTVSVPSHYSVWNKVIVAMVGKVSTDLYNDAQEWYMEVWNRVGARMAQLQQLNPGRPTTTASTPVQAYQMGPFAPSPPQNVTVRLDSQNLIDMNTLRREIPIKVRSLFTSGFTPLTSEKIPNPVPRDLSNFWDQVKKNIRSLGNDIEIEKLEAAHIKVLMPYIIGVSYLRFTDREYTTWSDFEATVDDRYGLNYSARQQIFRELSRGLNEDTYDFIDRIEATRIQYGIPDTSWCRAHFSPQFGQEFVNQMGILEMHRASLGVKEELQWNDLVTMVNNTRAGSWGRMSGGGRKLTGGDPTRPSRQAQKGRDMLGFVREKQQERFCNICKQLGRASHNTHNFDQCWGNPNNQYMKPSVYAHFVKLMIEGKLDVPELYPKPPYQRDTKADTSKADSVNYVEGKEDTSVPITPPQLQTIPEHDIFQQAVKAVEQYRQDKDKVMMLKERDMIGVTQQQKLACQQQWNQHMNDLKVNVVETVSNPQAPPKADVQSTLTSPPVVPIPSIPNPAPTVSPQPTSSPPVVPIPSIPNPAPTVSPQPTASPPPYQEKHVDQVCTAFNVTHDELVNGLQWLWSGAPDLVAAYNEARMEDSYDSDQPLANLAGYQPSQQQENVGDAAQYYDPNASYSNQQYPEQQYQGLGWNAANIQTQQQGFQHQGFQPPGSQGYPSQGGQQPLPTQSGNPSQFTNPTFQSSHPSRPQPSYTQATSAQTPTMDTTSAPQSNPSDEELMARLAQMLGAEAANRLLRPKQVTKRAIRPEDKLINSVLAALNRLNTNVPLHEILDYKPQLFAAVNLILLDISARTGRPMVVVEGLPIERIPASEVRSKLKAVSMQTMRDVHITEVPSDTQTGHMVGHTKQIQDNPKTHTQQVSTQAKPRGDMIGLTLQAWDKEIKAKIKALSDDQLIRFRADFDSRYREWQRTKSDQVNLTKTPTKDAMCMHMDNNTMVRVPAHMALPDWCNSNDINLRGWVPVSLSHYMAVIRIGRGVCEAVIDTGAAKTLIDYDTAIKMGLKVELATEEKSFGSFWGPSGPERKYYGRIPGEVRIEFGPGLYVCLKEIKVITSVEPMVLIGTDILTDSTQQWRFTNIGIHHETRVGCIIFSGRRDMFTVMLSSWPVPQGYLEDITAGLDLLKQKGTTVSPPHPIQYTQSTPDRCYFTQGSPDRTTNMNQRRKTEALKIPADTINAFLARAFDDVIYGKQMTDFDIPSHQDWEQWLKRFKLYDDQLTPEQLYLRYLKFHKLNFPAIPEDQWFQKYWDLLPFEPALVFGDSIGLCEKYPFHFKVEDSTPIRQKPIPYAREQREFLKTYMREQCELGVLREVIKGAEEDPIFVVGVVLVAGGQSQTDYRVCGNFVPTNGRIQPAAHPLIDTKAGIDGLQGCQVLCGIDVKAAFQNLWVPMDLQPYLGLVTQDGLFVGLRMQFGINAAPAMYQHVMTQVLEQPFEGVPVPAHSTYLDDCGIGRPEGINETWQDTLYAIKRLTWHGLPLNIWKCQFLTFNMNMLGMILWDSNIVLGDKAMKKFFGSTIPRDLKELQGLLGKLNFASAFIPNYRKLIQPLLNLMTKHTDGKWTQEHTEVLNTLAKLVHQRIRLGLCDMKQPAKIHVDVDDAYCSGVMTQGEGSELKIIAFFGRPLTITETKLVRMEQLLVAALWILKKAGRYTQYLSQLIVVLSHPAELTLITRPDLPVRYQAHIIELSSFGCKFELGVGVWANQSEMMKAHGLESCAPEIAKSSKIGALKIWEHEDVTLDLPALEAKLQHKDIKGAIVIYYDGGCSTKLGTGGYLGWDSNGECIGGEYKFYGDKCSTNNQAECQALNDALKWITTLNVSVQTPIIIRGDSHLIYSFMTGLAKPSNKPLLQGITEAKTLIKSKLRKHKLIFQHVGREDNGWADWLTRVAKNKQASGIITFTQGISRDKDPPLSIDVDFISMISHTHDPPLPSYTSQPANTPQPSTSSPPSPNNIAAAGPSPLSPQVSNPSSHSSPSSPPQQQQHKCTKCQKPGDLVECWGCNRKYHFSCLKHLAPEFKGPWHCQVCQFTHQQKGTRDITLDVVLIDFLTKGTVPDNFKARDRVFRAAKFVKIDEKGKMWIRKDSHTYREIVPMKKRVHMIQQIATNMAFPCGDKLYDAMKQYYYWDQMQGDILAVVTSMMPRIIESARFLQPPYLYPTEKGAAPFRIWCVDTMGPLKPAAPDGATHIIVAVDTFTKWVEAGTVPLKNSTEMAIWFHAEIVCRYGLPAIVRSDRGTEYSGAFDTYLQSQGIQHRRIATMNPRANGQVERMVGIIKSGMRRIQQNVPDSRWWENLPDILRAQRMMTTRATGYSPFFLVFKKPPALPLTHQVVTAEQEDLVDTGVDMESVYRFWDMIFYDVQERQNKYDARIKQQYLRRENLAEHDVRFVFDEGDWVLLKQKKPGKMQCKALGPFTFIKYTGPLGVNAIIEDADSVQQRVSASNLLPIQSNIGGINSKYSVPSEDELERQLYKQNQKSDTGSGSLNQNLTNVTGSDTWETPSSGKTSHGVSTSEETVTQPTTQSQSVWEQPLPSVGPSDFDSGTTGYTTTQDTKSSLP